MIPSCAIQNVIIAFLHALHAACKMIPSCVIRTIALPVSNSIAPSSIQHLPLTRVVKYLATVSPELELAYGSLCKACFTNLKKAVTYLATAENITNKLREKFGFSL